MVKREWNRYPEKEPNTKELIAATKHIIIDGRYKETQPDPDRKWTTHKGYYLIGVTHWMKKPISPNKGGLITDDGTTWTEMNSTKRPKIGQSYFTSSMFGVVEVLIFKGGKKWVSYYDESEPYLNITHWAELPANPNKR